MVEIVTATTDEHYRQARRLIEQYAADLGMDLEFQGFARELANLPAMYGPPRGRMILLREGAAYVGCVGLRPLPDGPAEMKRMYIEPAARGRGLGRALMDAFLAAAREMGYRSVRLDTLPPLTAALALYRAYGFREIGAYRYNPAPDAVYMELTL